jgi:hypothetical protein
MPTQKQSRNKNFKLDRREETIIALGFTGFEPRPFGHAEKAATSSACCRGIVSITVCVDAFKFESFVGFR